MTEVEKLKARIKELKAEIRSLKSYSSPGKNNKQMDDYEFNLKRGWGHDEDYRQDDDDDHGSAIKHFRDY